MKKIERKTIDDVKFSISLSMMLEPTGWGIGGNVSRMKDHLDKTLQDYIYIGFLSGDILIDNILRFNSDLGEGFLKSMKSIIEKTGTNTSFGTVFLIFFNAASIILKNKRDLNEIGEGAFSYLISIKPSIYFKSLMLTNSSFLHRFSSSLYPSLTDVFTNYEKWDDKKLIDFLRLNIFDPVSQEASTCFTNSIREAEKLIKEEHCSIPTSEEIDKLFRSFCCKYNDYIVYRKYGLERSESCARSCCEGKSPDELCSMGSLSDLVALTLFFYFYKCKSNNIMRKSNFPQF
ncbi:triphosphoribosyl-dephospho-CoA synthase [Fervidicoccus fontis]|uniref:Triphosphoribosyl-dephospho-CoA synthase n=2 Tax=Fervidicoccus fontis TaxID=683846 RepID=I0A213_FERFK|nr:triphosphoribosyl-dephospho-CoA synthase [Fervidicoccus fontis]AFH43020.1 hypothetical protein FFONT_1032 [Fervidicoccus fontis Kam940]MBE9391426.1 triphosphoribosyl-dephospho-CoA synthase [Fervidicoccus fontis]PMB75648.1 MAG: hypothetical protein C0188_02320 [Fervidicoccus fontis]PMB76568.1 MAG: hypothetical protein C0177_05695 [Fervidicoccus fontis]HEW63983.1 hypothetical protein [Fervidicoccus fontis]